MVEMKVEGLTLDPLTNMPIIILKDSTGSKALPIWVGYFEANAIALEIEKITTPRPMTHDLLRNLINTMQAKIEHILVSDLKDNTFYAVISLVYGGNTVSIDSRPSDAIALALRTKSPIYVEEKVIEAAKSLDLPDPKPRNWTKNSSGKTGWTISSRKTSANGKLSIPVGFFPSLKHIWVSLKIVSLIFNRATP